MIFRLSSDTVQRPHSSSDNLLSNLRASKILEVCIQLQISKTETNFPSLDNKRMIRETPR